MEITKNQHYVPQSYLRNFGEKNLVHISINKGNVFKKTVKKVCSEQFLYDVENFDLPDKQIIEHFYGKHIDAYFPLITKFCEDAKQQDLSPQMREMFVTCCLSLIFRHPNFINKNPNFSDEDIIIEKGNKQINYSKIKRVNAHLENFKRIVDLRINDGIAVSFCDLKTEFITNDNPVLITNAAIQLESHFDLSNMLYLTLTPRICITFTPSDDKDLIGTFQKTLMSKDQVFLINSRVDEQSEMTLIGTEKGLNNYFQEKEFYSDEKNGLEYLERVKQHFEVVSEVYRIAQVEGPISDKLETFMDDKLKEIPSLKENLSFMQQLFQIKLIKQSKEKEVAFEVAD
jgi:hypothetical protein